MNRQTEIRQTRYQPRLMQAVLIMCPRWPLLLPFYL